MARTNKIWYDFSRFFNRSRRVHAVWNALFTAVLLLLACLAIGILLHLLINAFSTETPAAMKYK